MIQFSVYGRIVNGMDNLKKHTKRLADNLPPEGSVRCIQISEKQFGKMVLLVGKPKKQEKTVTAEQLVLL